MIDNFYPDSVGLWVVADDSPADPPRLGRVIGWTLLDPGELLPVVVEVDEADGELRGWPWVWRHNPRGRFPRRISYHPDLRAAEQRMRELDKPSRTRVVDLDDLTRRSTR